MERTILTILPVAITLLPSLVVADEPVQSPRTLDVQVRVQMDYLISLPKVYRAEGKPSPLLLFLHGAGERGSDLNLVKKHGPPKLIDAGKSFPFIVVSPQCASDHIWEPHMLTALLDKVIDEYNVDEDRIYVTGLSMGGFGTWSLAAYTPKRFAAIAPICGGSERFRAKYIKDIPVWAFHGAKDSVVPLSRSEQMINELKKLNADAKLTVYPEAFHDSWTETYDNPELYQWLLSHSLETRERSRN